MSAGALTRTPAARCERCASARSLSTRRRISAQVWRAMAIACASPTMPPLPFRGIVRTLPLRLGVVLQDGGRHPTGHSPGPSGEPHGATARRSTCGASPRGRVGAPAQRRSGGVQPACPTAQAIVMLSNPRLDGRNIHYDARLLTRAIPPAGAESTLFIDRYGAPCNSGQNNPAYSDYPR